MPAAAAAEGDAFSKAQLGIGRVTSVSDHPSGSEKLWLCKVDIGGGKERQVRGAALPVLPPGEPAAHWGALSRPACRRWVAPPAARDATLPGPPCPPPSPQVVAGLKQHISREELSGRLVALVLNLRPAKLAGELSEAMMLAADHAPVRGWLEGLANAQVLLLLAHSGRSTQLDCRALHGVCTASCCLPGEVLHFCALLSVVTACCRACRRRRAAPCWCGCCQCPRPASPAMLCSWRAGPRQLSTRRSARARWAAAAAVAGPCRPLRGLATPLLAAGCPPDLRVAAPAEFCQAAAPAGGGSTPACKIETRSIYLPARLSATSCALANPMRPCPPCHAAVEGSCGRARSLWRHSMLQGHAALHSARPADRGRHARRRRHPLRAGVPVQLWGHLRGC